jgi:hypothetical protein
MSAEDREWRNKHMQELREYHEASSKQSVWEEPATKEVPPVDELPFN